MAQYQDDYGMDCIQAHSMRDLVAQVNNKGIAKEDIVQIVTLDDTLFLLYYK
jgi:hypothetical protein